MRHCCRHSYACIILMCLRYRERNGGVISLAFLVFCIYDAVLTLTASNGAKAIVTTRVLLQFVCKLLFKLSLYRHASNHTICWTALVSRVMASSARVAVTFVVAHTRILSERNILAAVLHLNIRLSMKVSKLLENHCN